tara:strand:+ start:1502 stop:1933 length:432 start_codon:yes stop_codon:yes gene_type:complete
LILVLTSIIVLTVDAKTPKDLIIHLPFEEEGGKVAKDISPNKFVDEVKNAKWVEGVQGKALEFNEGSVKFEPLKVDEPKELTIEFWFKPAKKFSGGNRMDMMYRKNGGGRPHITFNRGGVLFGHYFANRGAELEIRSQFVEFE